ncbi:unnamed protein product [Rhizopus microsporus]
MADRIAQAEEQGISISSNNINRLLDGGVPAYKITEISGESGSGKTQVCMQLAVNVQLKPEEGGVQGECIYIDTEGSFLTSRLIDMARKYDIESVSKGIHLFRVLNHIELIALVRQLPSILKEYTNVKLIIIDSIAYHFRLNTMDSKRRTHFVNYIGHSLVQIATKNKLAIIVTNHVTINGIDGRWTPSLGPSWGHWCHNRLYLYRKRQFRFGYLFKAFESSQQIPVQFCIKENGLGDPDEQEMALFKTEGEGINNKMESTLEELQLSASSEVKAEEDWDEIEVMDDVPSESIIIDTELQPSQPVTHGRKRPRGDKEDSEAEYWSSDIEEDLHFLINMQETF